MIFAKNMMSDGSIEQAEYKLLEFFINHAGKSIASLEKERKIIYVHLQCMPETSLARIKQRGREMEQGITLEYLKGLRE